jgi:hypothetical protein
LTAGYGLVLGALLAAGDVRSESGPGGPDDPKVDFNRDVRPILANTCLLCHGPDAKNRKADLRLDTREGATANLDGKFAIVPGKTGQSELVRRITSTDRDEVMPPPKSGKKLSPSQIETLTRWISQGAPYARHWSFAKPERPLLPAVRDAAWGRNAIDRFILARLEQEGLRPSGEADRYALVRRLAIDLTGLPPTIEEADAFAKDPDPASYEKVVDRFMASPAYGERWARVWLDLARYADSQGYAEDRPRTIWAYRDWVIRALNENLSFDRFTVLQLAGDLLPRPSEADLQATAFHRNTLTNTEGGTDREEFRNAAIVDRVNTTMQVWLGLTFNCAQCHDHKFDPFTQEEFFRIFAFLNNTEDADRGDDSPVLQLFSEEQKRRKRELQEVLARLEATLGASTPALEASQKRWEADLKVAVAWKPLKCTEAQEDGMIPTPQNSVSIQGTSGLSSLTAVRIEVPAGPEFLLSRASLFGVPEDRRAPPARFVRVELPGAKRYLHLAEVQVFAGKDNVAARGTARQSSTDFGGEAQRAIDGNTNGDYNANSVSHTKLEDNPWWEVDLGKAIAVDRVLIWNRTDGGEPILSRMKDYRVTLLDDARHPVEERKSPGYPNPKDEWTLDGMKALALKGAQADHERREHPARSILEGAGKGGWSAPVDGQGHEVTLVLEKSWPIPAKTALLLKLDQRGIPRLRILCSDDPRAAAAAELPGEIRAILGKSEAQRTKGEAESLAAHYRTVAPELAPLRERHKALRQELEGTKPATTVPIQRELAPGQRRRTAIQIRGNFLVKGKEVSEGTPATLPPLPDGEPRNRLALARWLVSPENPLSARVVVNRHWEQLFGVGLVTTSEDWGVRGELPSHPELLDYLATDLVAHGWDVKRLVREIVTSAAYRQSSQLSPELGSKDPANRLLARGPRVRLSAEGVRDQALWVAGLLSPKMYGPSVYPQQPRSGLSAAFSSTTDWETSKGEDKFRRGLYTFWRRSVPYPSMATFDAPDRNVCTVKRIPTNTPLQALVTMNDPVYVEASQGLARVMVAQGGTSARERASHGFRRCLSRPPRAAELDRLVSLFEETRRHYAADPKQAAAMATQPLGPAPEGADVADLAAWTVVGNVLLNLDEMFMKR